MPNNHRRDFNGPRVTKFCLLLREGVQTHSSLHFPFPYNILPTPFSLKTTSLSLLIKLYTRDILRPYQSQSWPSHSDVIWEEDKKRPVRIKPKKIIRIWITGLEAGCRKTLNLWPYKHFQMEEERTWWLSVPQKLISSTCQRNMVFRICIPYGKKNSYHFLHQTFSSILNKNLNCYLHSSR